MSPSNSKNKRPDLIIHWNSQSIANKLDSLKLTIKRLKPAIVSIQETWLGLDSLQSNSLNIPGYNTHNFPLSFRNAGLLLYIHKSFSCRPLPVLKPDAPFKSSSQIVFLEVCSSFHAPFLFCSLYRNPHATAGTCQKFVQPLALPLLCPSLSSLALTLMRGIACGQIQLAIQLVVPWLICFPLYPWNHSTSTSFLVSPHTLRQGQSLTLLLLPTRSSSATSPISTTTR
jgi:hypothetical protein